MLPWPVLTGLSTACRELAYQMPCLNHTKISSQCQLGLATSGMPVLPRSPHVPCAPLLCVCCVSCQAWYHWLHRKGFLLGSIKLTLFFFTFVISNAIFMAANFGPESCFFSRTGAGFEPQASRLPRLLCSGMVLACVPTSPTVFNDWIGYLKPIHLVILCTVSALYFNARARNCLCQS